METANGKIAMDDNKNDVVVIVDRNEGNGEMMKYPLNIKSIGGKEYNIGEDVVGVLAEDGKFNVCREYEHSRKGKIFGFISNDELNDDWITITVMTDFRPRLISHSSVRHYNGGYSVGEKITVRRSLIKNY